MGRATRLSRPAPGGAGRRGLPRPAGSASLRAAPNSGPRQDMPLSQRYELNNPPIVAELVEREVIAIDLERGSYYSLIGPAAQVWSSIVAGRSAQEILAAVVPAPDAGSLEGSLVGFLEVLLAEQLIRRATAQPPSSTPIAPLAPWPTGALRFERFTDMQDLLLLDPIHDVDDEAGWPKPIG